MDWDGQAMPAGVSERQIDLLKTKTFARREDMARVAASDIAERINSALAKKERVRVIFAAAPSQADTLDLLLARDDVDWSRVSAFHMDEYIGLPEGAPERFARWLDAQVFSRAAFGEVFPILPDPDPDSVVAEYAERLNAAPIDIVILGVGVNGHIAFNDPPVADFNDPYDVKVVELDDVCRQQQVDDKCFLAFDDVPTHAVTLTIPRLLRADSLFCVAPGALKRVAVNDMLNGPIETACPASILRKQAHCTLYLDKESDPDVAK